MGITKKIFEATERASIGLVKMFSIYEKKKIVVDFYNDNTFKNTSGHIYTIKLQLKIPKNNHIIYFNNHPKESLKRLYVSRYKNINSLNIELNKRLSACHPNDEFGVDDFIFKNVSGTVYFFVVPLIRKETVDKIEVPHFTNSPILILKNGFREFKSIFLFDDKRLKNIHKGDKKERNFLIHTSQLDQLWCCESSKRLDLKKKKKIIMIHDNESTDIVENIVHTSKMHTTTKDKYESKSDDENNNNNI